MKFGKKVLAGLMAFVVMLGVVGLPVVKLANSLAAAAVSTTVSTKTLIVKSVDKNYDVSNNNFLTYADYCDNYTKVTVYGPDGSRIADEGNGVYFSTPGLHALQFVLNESAGFDIYSDVIYIPVGTNNLDGIVLDGALKANVKPGTIVDCPMAITASGDEDNAVTLKVYTPYGEEVAASKNSITNRWSFVNKTDVLGTYFVEYTKTVAVGKTSTTLYKYEQIEFASDSTETVSTKYFDSETKEGEAQIVVSATGLAGEEKDLMLYKYYDIANAYVANEDGSTDTTVDLFLTIQDVESGKFYNPATEKFDILTSTDAQIEIEQDTNPFVDRAIDNLKLDGNPSLSGVGHKIKFVFKATRGGKELEKTIEKTEKFNSGAIVLSSANLLPSEITNLVIVDQVNSYDVASIPFYGIAIAAEGYDKEGLEELIQKVELQVSPEGGSIVSSNNDKDANGVGIDVVGTDPLTQSFVYYYNKNVTSELKFSLEYIVTVGKAIDSDLVTTLTKPYTIYGRTESQDKTAPSKLIIGSYPTVSTDGKFVIPSATAEDKDDNNKPTTGAAVSVTIVGGDYVVEETVALGQTLENLSSGIYTLKFTAVDAAGNTRSKFVGFKVERGQANTAPSIYASSVTCENEDGRLQFNLDTNATGVTVFGGEDGQFSPSNIEFANGKVSKFEFDFDVEERGCVVVVSRSNSYATTYIAIKVGDGQVENEIAALGYGKLSGGYTLITPNTTIDGNVFDKMIWFGGSNFEIEAPEGALYTLSNDNEFTFYTAGTYTITSTERNEVEGVLTEMTAVTTLQIKNENTKLTPSQPLGHKLVAERGDEFDINIPVVLNYHGYEVEIFVKDSTGAEVTDAIINYGESYAFVAPGKDEYTIEYKYRGHNIQRETLPITVSTGNVATPQITLAGNNENVIWEGSTIKYYIQNATSVDKNGKTVATSISCFDKYGKALEVLTDGDKKYVELKGAGFYTVVYTAIDEEDLMTVVESVFAVEFAEDAESDGLSAWAIVGIVLGSIAGACAIAFVVFLAIRASKKKTRFINKAKQEKKQEKKERNANSNNYTIAESKDEKHWLVKNGNRTIAKVGSKAEAIEKAKEDNKKGELTIKVYNKNGRLIDSI